MKYILLLLMLSPMSQFKVNGKKMVFVAFAHDVALMRVAIQDSSIANFMPEWEKMMARDEYFFNGGVVKHTLEAMEASQGTARMLMFFHDLGKLHRNYSERNKQLHPYYSAQIASVVLEDVGYDKNDIDKLCFLIEHHGTIGEFPMMYTKQSLLHLLDGLIDTNMIDILEQMNLADVEGRGWIGKVWNRLRIKMSFEYIRAYKRGEYTFDDIHRFFRKNRYIHYLIEKHLKVVSQLNVSKYLLRDVIDRLFMYNVEIDDFKIIDKIMMAI